MTMPEVIDLMAGMRAYVNGRTLAAVNQVIALSQAWDFLGENFTFDASADLDAEVNRLLVQLSDAIMEETERRAEAAADEETRETALIWARRAMDGHDTVWRLDRHCSDLKFALEGYLAVCFARNIAGPEVFGGVTAFLNSPNTWAPMREAAQGTSFRSRFASEGGIHFGRGVATDPREGMTLVAQTFINEAHQKATLEGYARTRGVIGYRVHRGSSYDCPECDDLCRGIHPLGEQVLPAHPRCVCFTTPVRAEDLF